MKQSPFFSILIPTRNRPEMLKFGLSSLTYQNFRDFEVIISDNSDPEIQEKNLATVKKFDTLNINYVRPPEPLNMPDNWEFGYSFAKGKYQGVLEDKLFLKAHALSDLYEVLKQDEEIDLINFLHIGVEYFPHRLFKFRRIMEIMKPSHELTETYCAQKELERKFQFEKSIRSDFSADELRFFSFGKVLFGFYSKKLVNQIREHCGRVFSLVSVDYTSCALALHFAQKPLLYNKELALGICNYKGGNWFNVRTRPGALKNFLKTCDPSLKFLDDLPIPRLYSAIHNLIAYDYDILKRNNLGSYKINLENLAKRCAEDLMAFPFSSESEKEEQTKLLDDFAQKIGVDLSNVQKLKEWKPEKFITKLKRYLFKKPLKEKWYAIKKRLLCELKYIKLKSLLMEQ